MSAMASQNTSVTIVYSTVYSGAHQRKHQSSASLAFVMGIHWGSVTRKMFPFYDVITWMTLAQELKYDKPAFVRVKAWYRQATSHYLSECWPTSMSPSVVTWPQSLTEETKWPLFCIRHFQKHFLNDKSCILIEMLLYYVPNGANSNKSPLVEAMPWRQTITWNYDDLVHCRIYNSRAIVYQLPCTEQKNCHIAQPDEICLWFLLYFVSLYTRVPL